MFLYRLASARGWRSVGEMTEEMSYPEMLSWAGYYSIEGWPEWRADIRSALICSVIANTNRDPEKKPEPFTVDDFLLFRRDREVEIEEDVVEEDEGATVAPDIAVWLFAKSGAVDVLQAELEADRHGS